MSLKAWDEVGMLDREVALYERLRDRGMSISFVTYGGSSELDYESRVPGIQILCNRWGFPNRVYEQLLHRFHGKALKACDLIKTNQMNGALVAFRCARFWEKSLICRCGYMWSQFARNESGSAAKIEKLEDEIFSSAENIVVTTDEMKNNIMTRSLESNAKTVVIPNYVETDRFAPDADVEKENELLFVGRLAPQKNIVVLLSALDKVDVETQIIGNGQFKEKVLEAVENSEGKMRWKGNVPNRELPAFMNRSSIFILPSLYEGHPKTLIEAMSCGLPVIGTDSPGIKELIDHGVNGYLCGTDSESIGNAIEELMSRPKLRKKLGRNARQFTVENFSLDRIVEMELELYREILERKKHQLS